MPFSKAKEKLGGSFSHPVASFTATRRNLPHWQEPDSIYFITWRLRGDEALSPEERTSARTINAQRGIRGTLWQDERYDRIIRDEAELLQKWQYLRQNPVERGLASNPEDYPWLYEKS